VRTNRPEEEQDMSLRDSRLTRALTGSLAPLLAGICFLACSASSAESSDQTSQASTAAGRGVFHSNVTRQSWHHHVGENHGGWDDERRCHPGPLALCPLLDTDFIGVDAGPSCANVTTTDCPDRVDTWDDAIVFDFAVALSADCRFGQWAPPLLTDTDVTNYLNDLLAFTLQLFGCPLDGTTTRLTFGLIPSALQGHKFTTADLDALSDTYAAAVEQALSDNGSPALTTEQAKSLDLKLGRLARRVPHTVRSRHFTFSTCAAGSPDGNAPADDDGDVDCR
jgi:hypothetical protein